MKKSEQFIAVVVRSIIPADITKNAIEWKVIPNQIPNWSRKPVIAHSQVGYHPFQQKKVILEVDPNNNYSGNIILQKLGNNDNFVDFVSEKPIKWGC